MQTITDTIDHLHLGKATTFEGLSVFPLFGESVREADYITLDEALEQELAQVVEVSEGGVVPASDSLMSRCGDR